MLQTCTGPDPPDLLLGHRRWRRREVRAFGHVIGRIDTRREMAQCRRRRGRHVINTSTVAISGSAHASSSSPSGRWYSMNSKWASDFAMLSYLLARWSEGGGGAAIPQNPGHLPSLFGRGGYTQLAQNGPALSSQTIATTKKYYRSTERQPFICEWRGVTVNPLPPWVVQIDAANSDEIVAEKLERTSYRSRFQTRYQCVNSV